MHYAPCVDRQALNEHTTTSSFTKSLGQALRVSLVKPGAYLSESYNGRKTGGQQQRSPCPSPCPRHPSRPDPAYDHETHNALRPRRLNSVWYSNRSVAKQKGANRCVMARKASCPSSLARFAPRQ